MKPAEIRKLVERDLALQDLPLVVFRELAYQAADRDELARINGVPVLDLIEVLDAMFYEQAN